MADPSTLILLTAMQTCLQRIQVANGYHTDAGGFVTLEPHQVQDDPSAADYHAELIGLVLDSKVRATDAAVVRTHRLATAVVLAKVVTTADNAQQRLHLLIDDIEQAFENRQAEFPKGYQFPVFVEAKPIPPAEGMTWIGAEVRFTSHVPKR